MSDKNLDVQIRVKNTTPFTQGQIEIYPVGLFDDIRRYTMMVRYPEVYSQWGNIRWFLKRFAQHARRRSYWNGYLAEWHYPPTNIVITKCGRGLTRKRAIKSLGIHIAMSNARKI